MLPIGDSLQLYRHTRLKSERTEDDIPSKWKSKAGRQSILVSDKTDFKPKE